MVHQDDDPTYPLRFVPFEDTTLVLACHDCSSPSAPLLALYNALTLSHAIPSLSHDREEVSLSYVLRALTNFLVNGQMPAEKIVQALRCLPHLASGGTSVNPRFDGGWKEWAEHSPTSATHHEKEINIFEAFGIQLVHGWIPSAESKALFGELSHEQALTLISLGEQTREEKGPADTFSPEEMQLLVRADAVSEFIDSTPSRFTQSGLEHLQKTLEAEKPAVLWRGDEGWSVVVKHREGGGLFTLVTDNRWAGHEEIVWASLNPDNSSAQVEYFNTMWIPRDIDSFSPTTSTTPRAKAEELAAIASHFANQDRLISHYQQAAQIRAISAKKDAAIETRADDRIIEGRGGERTFVFVDRDKTKMGLKLKGNKVKAKDKGENGARAGCVLM
ncbi:hypothetical protein SAICODRAFT_28633 [Saitoella complicata NRRL Y-17804]|uniref:MINDY deubiquitinase domain-containing protein n=1 Tax=Saitoella complicata (strain BCRC 22490 / CBS 7301 / JCM 7358 / NBRC 10748 / NRRL Y-17804) TaxID=698492 RepID=A0A0E9N9C1_SAICN|nr:uncharacterized protein SAICODRAFT_28633 [Saitoella complicata NRRL Y-17804]ODQ56542.1 hypothetical protein SAICODRAFT_28633 [Saitoella complicata NRRL Y-17804]GAO46482.1 hypothetical protein G7K_0713-t1 [Saitoella complicata NRRL Y-17804]